MYVVGEAGPSVSSKWDTSPMMRGRYTLVRSLVEGRPARCGEHHRPRVGRPGKAYVEISPSESRSATIAEWINEIKPFEGPLTFSANPVLRGRC
jgi:hypothetical protein